MEQMLLSRVADFKLLNASAQNHLVGQLRSHYSEIQVTL